MVSGLTLPRTPQSHQCGIQQIQRDAEPNFPNKRGPDPVFGSRMRLRVERLEFVRAGLGAGYQVVRIGKRVEEPRA